MLGLLLFGCTVGVAEDVADGGADASIDGAEADASGDRVWSSAILLEELWADSETRAPAPSTDGLSLLFTRLEQVDSFSVNVLYQSRRSSLDETFGPPLRLSPFSTTSVSDLEVGGSESELYLVRSLGQLAVATKQAGQDDWIGPFELGVEGISPSLSLDELSLFYRSLDNRLLVCFRSSRVSGWQPPVAVDLRFSVAMNSVDVSNDGLSLLVTMPPNSPEAGAYLLTRNNLQESFGRAIRIESLVGAFRNARFGAFDQEIFLVASYAGRDALFVSRLSPR